MAETVHFESCVFKWQELLKSCQINILDELQPNKTTPLSSSSTMTLETNPASCLGLTQPPEIQNEHFATTPQKHYHLIERHNPITNQQHLLALTTKST